MKKLNFETLENLKEIMQVFGDPETGEGATIEPDNLKELVNHAGFENWLDLCTAWLEASNYRYDDQKEVWVDEENGGEEVEGDPSEIVVNGGYELDVLEWSREENRDKFQEALRNWREERKNQILTSQKANEIFAKEAAERWKLDYDEVLANLETDGRLGWKIRHALLDWDTDLFDMEDPETGESLVPKMLSVSHARHTLTNYDSINKRGMDEFEVDELRREANRQAR